MVLFYKDLNPEAVYTFAIFLGLVRRGKFFIII